MTTSPPASQEPLSTTLGACTICNRKLPPGWAATRAGAVILGLGVAAELVGWFLRWPQLFGVQCAIGVGLGGPLLLWGILSGLRQPSTFARGRLVLDKSVAKPGSSIRVRFSLRPDHPLTLRMLTCELQACEEAADASNDAEPRVVRSVDTSMSERGPISTAMERELNLAIPADWPPTMETPRGLDVPHLKVFTRVRVAVDFDAHPLFELEQRLAIAAVRANR